MSNINIGILIILWFALIGGYFALIGFSIYWVYLWITQALVPTFWQFVGIVVVVAGVLGGGSRSNSNS